MTDDLDARIRERLDENYGDDWNGHVFAMDVALRAVVAVNREHREVLTARGRYPERLEECHCLGCQSVRAVADALGLAETSAGTP